MLKNIYSWNEVYTYDSDEFCTPNGTTFILERIGNDIYGNPLYHLRLDRFGFEKLCNIKASERIGRLYRDKKFLSLQSYNTGYDLERLFKKCGIETDLKPYNFI